jgi:hypothetical protein
MPAQGVEIEPCIRESPPRCIGRLIAEQAEYPLEVACGNVLFEVLQ